MKINFQRKLWLLIAVSFLSTSVLAAEKKVALIWGNATYYGEWQSLPVVKNDANTMKRILESLGYQTCIMQDGTLEMMKTSLREFASYAKNADIAIFYYSGHATRINDEYYVVPAKTRIGSDYFASDFLPAHDILSVLSKSRLKLLFFDSCRDGATIGGETKGNPNIVTSEDVGPLTGGAPSGTMICYAADKGKKAYTGTGELSIFTKVLSDHITDGDEFRTVWSNIINEVYLVQKQRPVNDGFYLHDLYLNPMGKKHTAPAQNLSQRTSQTTEQTTTQTNNNKKSISIIPNAPGATIDFYGTKYEAGKSLLYEIGKTYTYTITAEGYNSYVGSLKVTESTPSTINITMQKNESATLRITSNTSAKVTFDGKSIGTTPITINTTSGTHSLSLSANKYYGHTSKIDLDAGANTKHIPLTHKTPWFIDWDDSDAPANYLSYHYSPKYQIGLQYLYRFEDTHFLLGANVALSPGLFRGLKMVDVTASTSAYTETTTTTIDEHGNTVAYNTLTTTTSGIADEYSDEIDPYHEAKTYDSNFMFLVSGGYMPCNGILLEAGFGAASHCDKTYMPYNYSVTKTVTTNLNTGNVVGEPTYEYTRNEGSHWYNGKVKWSPAMRLGMKFNIPIGIETYLTVGGGYTYLFSNNKFSSWNVSIGFAWAL